MTTGWDEIFARFECQNGATFRLVYSPVRDQILSLKQTKENKTI